MFFMDFLRRHKLLHTMLSVDSLRFLWMIVSNLMKFCVLPLFVVVVDFCLGRIDYRSYRPSHETRFDMFGGFSFFLLWYFCFPKIVQTFGIFLVSH